MPSSVVFQNFDSTTRVSFRISRRVHARAGIQGIQKRIWIHALRVRSGHNVLERLKKAQVNGRVSLASGEKFSLEPVTRISFNIRTSMSDEALVTL